MSSSRKRPLVAIAIAVLFAGVAVLFSGPDPLKGGDVESTSQAGHEVKTAVEIEPAEVDHRTGGVLSVEELRAHFAPLYQQHLSAAEKGDPDSQFIVGISLLSCQGYSPTMVDNLYAYPDVLGPPSEELIEETRSVQEQCGGFEELVGLEQMGGLAEAWLSTAADEGHLLARLKYELLYGPKDLNSLRAQLPYSLEYFGRSSLHSLEVVRVFESYQGQFGMLTNDPEVNGYRLGAEEETFAWTYLECLYRFGCGSDEFERVAGAIFTPAQVQDIQIRASKLLEALRTRDVSALLPDP